MKSGIIATVTFFLLLVSCASQNGVVNNQSLQRSNNSSVVMQVPFNSLWDDALAYFESDEIRMTVRNAERGYIESNYIDLKHSEAKRYIRPGSDRLNSNEKVRLKSTIYFWRVNENETLMKIFTSAEVYEEPTRISSGGWFVVYSNGNFEKEIAQGILEYQNLAEK